MDGSAAKPATGKGKLSTTVTEKGALASYGVRAQMSRAVLMSDDDFVTKRLKTLADVTVGEMESTGDTIELEEMDLMATGELEGLLGSSEADSKDGSAAGESGSTDDTLEPEGLDLMGTAELKQLLEGDSSNAADDDTDIIESPDLKSKAELELVPGREATGDVDLQVEEDGEAGIGSDPYNRV